MEISEIRARRKKAEKEITLILANLQKETLCNVVNVSYERHTMETAIESITVSHHFHFDLMIPKP